MGPSASASCQRADLLVCARRLRLARLHGRHEPERQKGKQSQLANQLERCAKSHRCPLHTGRLEQQHEPRQRRHEQLQAGLASLHQKCLTQSIRLHHPNVAELGLRMCACFLLLLLFRVANVFLFCFFSILYLLLFLLLLTFL